MPKHWEDVTVHGGRTIQVPVRGDAIQSKDRRGFHAEWSARRLVDRTARDEFDDDPETLVLHPMGCMHANIVPLLASVMGSAAG